MLEISHLRGRPPQVIADDWAFSPDPRLPSGFPVEEPIALAPHACFGVGMGLLGAIDTAFLLHKFLSPRQQITLNSSIANTSMSKLTL